MEGNSLPTKELHVLKDFQIPFPIFCFNLNTLDTNSSTSGIMFGLVVINHPLNFLFMALTEFTNTKTLCSFLPVGESFMQNVISLDRDLNLLSSSTLEQTCKRQRLNINRNGSISTAQTILDLMLCFRHEPIQTSVWKKYFFCSSFVNIDAI